MAEDTPSSESRWRDNPKVKKAHSFEEELFDEDGKITSEGAQKAIKAGHSVMVGMTVVNHPAHPLISEASLAKGNAVREKHALDNLLEQKKAIDDMIAGLGSKGESNVVSHVEDPSLEAPQGGLGQGDTAGNKAEVQAKSEAKK